MGKPKERVEEKLRLGVKALGGKAYKLISPGNGGMPDRLVCLPNGKTVFVELKSPAGRLSEQQKHRIAELKELGQDVRVICSVGEVEEFMKTEGESRRGIHTA